MQWESGARVPVSAVLGRKAREHGRFGPVLQSGLATVALCCWKQAGVERPQESAQAREQPASLMVIDWRSELKEAAGDRAQAAESVRRQAADATRTGAKPSPPPPQGRPANQVFLL